MLTLEFDLSALEKQLDNIETAVGDAIRPAAQAGAQVFYDEVKARTLLMKSKEVHYTKGKKQAYAPGNLHRSIYQAFDDDGSTPNKVASYGISWNKKKAFYGRFLENGTKRMPAHPFMRPSYDAVNQKAVDAVNDRLEQELKGKL